MPDQMFSTSDLALYIGRPIQTCGLIVLPSVCGIFTLGTVVKRIKLYNELIANAI